MRRLATGALGLAAALGQGCLPILTPPARVDVGMAQQTSGAREGIARLSVGVHAASLVPDSGFPIDVGAGFVHNEGSRSHRRPDAQGAYLEATPRLAGGDHWRVLAGGRGELYFPRGYTQELGYGAMARGSVELMLPVPGAPVASSGGRGFFFGGAYGVLAIGPYLEAGYQRFPSGEASPAVGGGVQIRLPALAGIVCCLWPK